MLLGECPKSGPLHAWEVLKDMLGSHTWLLRMLQWRMTLATWPQLKKDWLQGPAADQPAVADVGRLGLQGKLRGGCQTLDLKPAAAGGLLCIGVHTWMMLVVCLGTRLH